ncbi:MAG: MJ1477/TM1410 family putative glycoside hydrolase [Candidatus Hermodarchaeota archaeon]
MTKNYMFLQMTQLDRIEFEIRDIEFDDFAYWLDDIDKKEVKNSNYDLMIIDYSSDGSESEEFSSKDIDYMKSSGSKEKTLISYISIGEAEDYRFYWDDSWDEGNPEWLGEENPDWEGNYKVKFWMSGWQNIVYNYLNRILSSDFDGIYMDIIDAYEYYEDDVIHSDWLMIDFVENISNYVKGIEGKDFLVFVQNADELLSNSTYLSHIDGIGREDLFFDDDDETDEEEREYSIDNLNEVLEEDKAVLIIDYTSENKYDFYKYSIDNGYLPYVAERDLNTLKEYWMYKAT